ncbi:MAG TPA: AtpZ/AtpI family protein [Melioribacteraceae bacterium]|nr:AtpZ/AtpI family protein [Melioribacteraceae bacterium]
MSKNNEETGKQLRQVGPYLGLGTQLAATIVLMFFLGNYLDEKLDIFPYLTIGFALFGGFAGVYNFIKTVLDLNKKSKNIERK